MDSKNQKRRRADGDNRAYNTMKRLSVHVDVPSPRKFTPSLNLREDIGEARSYKVEKMPFRKKSSDIFNYSGHDGMTVSEHIHPKPSLFGEAIVTINSSVYNVPSLLYMCIGVVARLDRQVTDALDAPFKQFKREFQQNILCSIAKAEVDRFNFMNGHITNFMTQPCVDCKATILKIMKTEMERNVNALSDEIFSGLDGKRAYTTLSIFRDRLPKDESLQKSYIRHMRWKLQNMFCDNCVHGRPSVFVLDFIKFLRGIDIIKTPDYLIKSMCGWNDDRKRISFLWCKRCWHNEVIIRVSTAKKRIERNNSVRRMGFDILNVICDRQTKFPLTRHPGKGISVSSRVAFSIRRPTTKETPTSSGANIKELESTEKEKVDEYGSNFSLTNSPTEKIDENTDGDEDADEHGNLRDFVVYEGENSEENDFVDQEVADDVDEILEIFSEEE